MNRYIFLDIDGVLNYSGTKSFIVRKKLALVKQLAADTNAIVVLISDWRLDLLPSAAYPEKGRHIRNCFEKEGIPLTVVSTVPRYEIRGDEIRKYIEKFPCDGFVIIDDEDFEEYYDDDLYPHFVQTNYKKGLTEEDIEKAKEILKNRSGL